jgi:hypothetical protein
MLDSVVRIGSTDRVEEPALTRRSDMKRRVFGSCTILALALAIMPASALADDEKNGLEGAWLADITPANCNNWLPIPGAPVFKGLYMFGHDGSLTNEAAFPVSSPRRSSGLGAWRHAQAQTYTATFQFFRYNDDFATLPDDGSFLAMRRVASTLVLHGDQFTSRDAFQDFDFKNMPVLFPGSSGCNTVTANRIQ